MTDNPSDPGATAGWEPLGEEEVPARGWGPRLLVAGIALLAAAVFVGQNRERVETKFLLFSGTPRLWVIIVFSLVLGALLGQAIPAVFRRRKSKTAKTRDKDRKDKKDAKDD